MGRSDATPILRNYWKPDGKINRQNEGKLKSWMRKHCLDGKDITSFLYMEIFRDARSQAARELNLEKSAADHSNEIKTLRGFWKPAGKVHAGNKKKLQQAIKESGVEEESISHFLYHPGYKGHQKRVLKRLDL